MHDIGLLIGLSNIPRRHCIDGRWAFRVIINLRNAVLPNRVRESHLAFRHQLASKKGYENTRTLATIDPPRKGASSDVAFLKLAKYSLDTVRTASP